jgi:pimeloyl-ACP methyl ester carboxylesterase
MRAFTELSVPVEGGFLRAIHWGPMPADARATVIAAHGITANSRSLIGIAEHIADDICFVAVDLRGRGDSADLPGPYGMAAHGDDLLAVADHIGAETFVAAGHSMGAYVVANLAARSDRVTSVVLWDGGFPLPVPEGVEPDQVIEAVIGPAIARLSMTFESEDAYFDFWKAHPAFEEWTDTCEAYFSYDLGGEAGAFRPRPNEEAIRADGRQLVVDEEAINALRRVHQPVELVRCTRGVMNEPGGLIPEPFAEAAAAEMDNLDLHTVDTNHYALGLGDGAAHAAAAVERAITRVA